MGKVFGKVTTFFTHLPEAHEMHRCYTRKSLNATDKSLYASPLKSRYSKPLFLISGCSCGLVGRGEPTLINSIPGDANDGQCDRLEEEVARADRDTLVEDPPRLTGKWVSEG
jgi:hypothetical protein